MNTKKKKTVLVVNDEPDTQLFLSTVLEDAGFDVMTADNGKHALKRISEHKPDLISLDLVMPKMGGVKLLAYLQKNPQWADIPFIIVTAHTHDEMEKKISYEIESRESSRRSPFPYRKTNSTLRIY